MTQRNFRQHAQGHGTTPSTVTVTIDGNTVYNGTVNTVDQPLPPLPNPATEVTNVGWSWQENAEFQGTQALSITVSGSPLLLAETLADNPYAGNVQPGMGYVAFYNVEIDGVIYFDPLTDEKINGVAQSGPYRAEEPGQWWWVIPPGTTFTATINVNAAVVPLEPV